MKPNYAANFLLSATLDAGFSECIELCRSGVANNNLFFCQRHKIWENNGSRKIFLSATILSMKYLAHLNECEQTGS